ncbi:MAG: hypothetical protein JXB05_26295 [Myxococcaceae bacterium]|nr:hypothetical protein [Myxococcaceae bacterium]
MRKFEEYNQFQVYGATVLTFIEGFSAFTLLANQFLLDEQLGTTDGAGGLVIEKEKLYPMSNLLRAFARLGKEFGDLPLYRAGLTIQKNAFYPPSMLEQGIAGAFDFIDLGYYLNHATRDGKPLFDVVTQKVRHPDGIGHYALRAVPGKREIKGFIDAPYPCPYTHGVILGVAQRFEPSATVSHDPGPCRKLGDKACYFTIKWS